MNRKLKSILSIIMCSLCMWGCAGGTEDMIKDTVNQISDVILDGKEETESGILNEDELLKNHSMVVEITMDNVDEYMELIVLEYVDEFGEKDGSYRPAYRSKLYEKGYVLYDNTEFLIEFSYLGNTYTTPDPFSTMPFSDSSEGAIFENTKIENVKGTLVFIEKSALTTYECIDGKRTVNDFSVSGTGYYAENPY